MKKLFLLTLFVGISLTALNAQDVKSSNNTKENTVAEMPANGPVIKFTEQTHNYGTIQKGGDGNCEFTFTNEGNEPLILSNVKASCGCTVPTYTKEPIKPGEKGVIDVTYDGTDKFPGHFQKTITIRSNAVNEVVRLTIEGNME